MMCDEDNQRVHLCFWKSYIYVIESVKSASTPMETHKPLSKDAAGIDVDVHLY
nr:hypothetical protein [Tanacetum cinerariifolium]